MASVSELGYGGIGTNNEKAWQDLATNLLGMQVVLGDDKSSFYLRMDEYPHHIEVRANGNDDLDSVGREVPDTATLERVAQQLESGGVKVTSGTRDEAQYRRVIDLFKCADPNGIPTEIFCGRPVNQQPFYPSRPMSSFKTGELGMGHIVVCAQSLDQAVHFYRDLLGFRVSDFTEVSSGGGKLRLAFLHCNPRHHSIALLEAPGAFYAPQTISSAASHPRLIPRSIRDVQLGKMDIDCLSRTLAFMALNHGYLESGFSLNL